MDNDTIRKLLDEATPGPWQIGQLLPSTVFNWSVSPDHPDAVIADAGDEANARLIAAAPDLAAEVLRLRADIAAAREADLRAEVNTLATDNADYVRELFAVSSERDRHCAEAARLRALLDEARESGQKKHRRAQNAEASAQEAAWYLAMFDLYGVKECVTHARVALAKIGGQ